MVSGQNGFARVWWTGWLSCPCHPLEACWCVVAEGRVATLPIVQPHDRTPTVPDFLTNVRSSTRGTLGPGRWSESTRSFAARRVRLLAAPRWKANPRTAHRIFRSGCSIRRGASVCVRPSSRLPASKRWHRSNSGNLSLHTRAGLSRGTQCSGSGGVQ